MDILDQPHVFVVAGDITKIECDAWLLPTDGKPKIEPHFGPSVGLPDGGVLKGFTWGDNEQVRRWSAPGSRPEIWLGRIGTISTSDPKPFVEGLRVFVEEAARAIKAPAGRRPILAVPVIGGGKGGMGSHRGALHHALYNEMLSVSKAKQVDIVFVTKNRKAYSAAQRARRHVLQTELGGDKARLWDFGDRSSGLIEKAARVAALARDEELVLFIGAGASAGLSEGGGIPPWQELLNQVADEIDQQGVIDRDALQRHDLRDQAAILARHASGESLGQVVRKHLASGAGRYTLAHGMLCSLPSAENVTTNFDTMFEEACSSVDPQEPLAVLPYRPVTKRRQRWLLKLHGSVASEKDDLVLERSAYLDAPLRHGALYGLVQALLLTRHLLFVGYSLTDEDFHRVAHEVRMARGGDATTLATALTLFEDTLISEVWPDVDAIPMAEPNDEPTPADIMRAARRLLVFLDLLGFETANQQAFLLDNVYEQMLPDASDAIADVTDDRKLRAALRALEERANGHHGDGWTEVWELLRRFGAESAEFGAPN